jgi:hypothetical protein
MNFGLVAMTKSPYVPLQQSPKIGSKIESRYAKLARNDHP